MQGCLSKASADSGFFKDPAPNELFCFLESSGAFCILVFFLSLSLSVFLKIIKDDLWEGQLLAADLR